jgi:aminocarboxymuconate-semialdehyde decarboxylase
LEDCRHPQHDPCGRRTEDYAVSIDRRDLLLGAGALGVAAAAGEALAQQPGSQPAAQPRVQAGAPSRAKVIDVHTHMFSPGWMAAVRAAQDPDFRLGEGAQDGALIYRGSGIGRIVPSMLDFDIRIKAMDEAKVDVALISLTAPNVYWGTRAQSAAAARSINDDFAAAEKKYAGRIRWFASLPFQHTDDALAELRRAKANGAIGICTLTNILGTPLTAPQFRPIWREIEAMRLPVFVHPTTPYTDGMGLSEYGLGNTIGFTSDSSLCFARLILDGVLDELPNLQLIACHGGGAFPYLAARFDIMWERTGGARKIESPPSSYMRRLWFDSIVYDQKTLGFLIDQVGPDRVLYGSDYPFSIGDMQGVLARVDALPAAQRDAVRSGNAAQLFDL